MNDLPLCAHNPQTCPLSSVLESRCLAQGTLPSFSQSWSKSRYVAGPVTTLCPFPVPCLGGREGGGERQRNSPLSQREAMLLGHGGICTASQWGEFSSLHVSLQGQAKQTGLGRGLTAAMFDPRPCPHTNRDLIRVVAGTAFDLCWPRDPPKPRKPSV